MQNGGEKQLNRLSNHEVNALVGHNLVQIARIALQLHQQTAKRRKYSQSSSDETN
jgi:hypothetical protein